MQLLIKSTWENELFRELVSTVIFLLAAIVIIFEWHNWSIPDSDTYVGLSFLATFISWAKWSISYIN